MDDIRVSMGGTEMELRPISARQYLSARMEAEKIGEVLGEDDVAKAVLLGASLLAKGLFNGNKRMFESADEVLDTLSAEEIVNTAIYVDLKPETKMQIVETMDKMERFSQESDNLELQENTDASDSMSYSKPVPQQEQGILFTTYSNSATSVSQISTGRSLSPRSEMQRVSDFFQRDSRRYDGIISSY